MRTTPVLITIPISHYCEKARWALERACIPYTERQHMQGLHRVAVRRAGGGQTAPVLVTAEGVLPEMAARVSFLAKEVSAEAVKEPPKLVVPSAAVTERSGAKVVFVVEGDKVRMVPLVLGEPVGPGFEVKQGPKVGTRVVKDPPADLTDGKKIKATS